MPHDKIRFGPFELDTRAGELRRGEPGARALGQLDLVAALDSTASTIARAVP